MEFIFRYIYRKLKYKERVLAKSYILTELRLYSTLGRINQFVLKDLYNFLLIVPGNFLNPELYFLNRSKALLYWGNSFMEIVLHFKGDGVIFFEYSSYCTLYRSGKTILFKELIPLIEKFW